MATKKTPQVLDDMIEHVRYEALQVISFLRFGNGWCELLQPDLGQLTQQSLLEAALIHFRCLIEFLDEEPKKDQVMARDYLERWEWKAGDQLVRVRDLHGRVAHVGIVRRTVATSGPFSWQTWFLDTAPAVLAAFRDFLARLRDERPDRYDLFVQPREALPAIDLLPILDAMLA